MQLIWMRGDQTSGTERGVCDIVTGFHNSAIDSGCFLWFWIFLSFRYFALAISIIWQWLVRTMCACKCLGVFACVCVWANGRNVKITFDFSGFLSTFTDHHHHHHHDHRHLRNVLLRLRRAIVVAISQNANYQFRLRLTDVCVCLCDYIALSIAFVPLIFAFGLNRLNRLFYRHELVNGMLKFDWIICFQHTNASIRSIWKCQKATRRSAHTNDSQETLTSSSRIVE